MQACSKLPVIQAPVAAFDVRLYRDEPARAGIEAYIARRYARCHGAHVDAFPPYLMTAERAGGYAAALGLRPAGQSPLFLEFLMGKRDYECTPWGNPCYNLFGWQKPCYLLQDGYAKTFKELMETTDMAVVVSQSQNELKMLDDLGLDLFGQRAAGDRDHGGLGWEAGNLGGHGVGAAGQGGRVGAGGGRKLHGRAGDGQGRGGRGSAVDRDRAAQGGLDVSAEAGDGLERVAAEVSL